MGPSNNPPALPDDTVLERYCALDIDTRMVRTDQDDAADGLTAANDEDGDHVVIRTNGSTIEVEALEEGEAFGVATC